MVDGETRESAQLWSFGIVSRHDFDDGHSMDARTAWTPFLRLPPNHHFSILLLLLRFPAKTFAFQ